MLRPMSPLAGQSHSLGRSPLGRTEGPLTGFNMEGGQSEIEQKQQGRALGRNRFHLHAAGDAELPGTPSNLPKHTTIR